MKPGIDGDRLGPWALTTSYRAARGWLVFWSLSTVIMLASCIVSLATDRFDSLFWLSLVLLIVSGVFVARYTWPIWPGSVAR